MVRLPETKKELKNLCRLEIQILFTKMNLIKLVFNKIWLMAYGKSTDLTKRTQSDKVLRDKAFKIASDIKYDGYQRGLASMITSFLIKSLVGVLLLLSQIISLQMHVIGRLLENSRDEKFIHPLEIIFRVLI